MDIQQSYREAAVQGASPVDLVVQLYGQMIKDLQEAAIAIEQKNIERRTDRISHAILVASHLQSGLDLTNGGEVAQNLKHFYEVLRQSLLYVQFYPSKRGITQQIVDLLDVREGWIEVERAERLAGTAYDGVAPPPVAADPRGRYAMADREPVGARWKG